jgi:hypothetical protein
LSYCSGAANGVGIYTDRSRPAKLAAKRTTGTKREVKSKGANADGADSLIETYQSCRLLPAEDVANGQGAVTGAEAAGAEAITEEEGGYPVGGDRDWRVSQGVLETEITGDGESGLTAIEEIRIPELNAGTASVVPLQTIN